MEKMRLIAIKKINRLTALINSRFLIGIIVFDQSLFNDHDHIWRSVVIIMGVYCAECSG